MKSQSLLPTKIDGRDIVKTIKQSDPLDLAIWKLTSDGKKRTRAEICEQLRPYGFRREEVEERVFTLFCSSNRRWFDQQGKGAKTTYQLRKNRLERPFSRGGIEFESISNIRDILVIDEEAKRLFEETEMKQQPDPGTFDAFASVDSVGQSRDAMFNGSQTKQNQTTEKTMLNANKPSAPPMPDDESAAPVIDHSQLGAHNWFGAAAGTIAPEDVDKFSKPLENAPYDPHQSDGAEIAKRTLSANVDIPQPASQTEPTNFVQAGRTDQPMDPLLETTPDSKVSELEELHPMLAEVKRLLGSHPAVKQDWFDRTRDRLAKQPERPISVISEALDSLAISATEGFEILAALGKIEFEKVGFPDRSLGEVDTLSNGMPTISTPASRALASSLMEKGAAATWADIGPDAAAKRVRETGLAVSDLGSQNFAAPLALQQAEKEGRLGEHIADQIFTDGAGAKFQVVRTYRKDDLETTILRIFVQSERVFANRDLGDLLVGHPTTAIDYRVRKFLAAGLLKRIESGEGSDRRVYYHFNNDGRYTKPGQDVLDRMNDIAKEGVEHINSINVELGKYTVIPGGADPKLTSAVDASDSLTPFDADLFILGLPRSRMDSGMGWFGHLVGIYGRDVGKIEVAMQALVDKEQLTCSQLTQARDEFKRWARIENKEEVVDTSPNKSHGESELSSGALALLADRERTSEEVIQALLTSGEDRPADAAEKFFPRLKPSTGSKLMEMVEDARKIMDANVTRALYESLEAVFSDSELIRRYADNLVNSKDPALRKSTLDKLVTKLDPHAPVVELVKLANAALTAYRYFDPMDAGLDFALAATGADGLTASATLARHEWANLESSPDVDQVSIPYNTKPLIVVRGMVLTAAEAREIKNFVEGISSLSDSAAVPAVLKSARIEIQGRAYTFEEIEEIGIELLAIFN